MIQSSFNHTPIRRPPPEYPKLRRSCTGNGLIVLFTSDNSGTVVVEGTSKWSVGHHTNTWASDTFVDLSAGEYINISQV